MYEENTSGQGISATLPDELKGWNWGAFWLSWIWGIFNGSYIALLTLLPIANIIMPFYLGVKGNELAWRNKHWDSIEEFRESQRNWRNWGWIITVLLLICMVIRYENIHRNEQVTARITSQVMNIIRQNEEANKLVGEKYEMPFEPSIETVTSSNGEFPIGHIMFIDGESGIVNVYTSLDENYNIETITISPPSNGEKIIINVWNR